MGSLPAGSSPTPQAKQRRFTCILDRELVVDEFVETIKTDCLSTLS